MARPTKKGIDYFPLDVVLDDDLRLIEAEFKLKGFAVVVKLYQKIYGGFGYYCEWTKEVALLFSDEVRLGRNVVSEIVEASFRRGIFDRDIFEKFGVLTSRGIQKRYLDAVSRRKKIELIKEYLLLTIPEIRDIVGDNSINVNINSINVDINSQSKVKESKEEYSCYIAEQEDEKNSIAEILIDDVLLREMMIDAD